MFLHYKRVIWNVKVIGKKLFYGFDSARTPGVVGSTHVEGRKCLLRRPLVHTLGEDGEGESERGNQRVPTRWSLAQNFGVWVQGS